MKGGNITLLFSIFFVLALILGINSFDFASALTIPVGTTPVYIAFNENTNTIYVVNQGSDNVTVINGTTNTVITTIPVGTTPSGAEFVESVNLLYVLNQGSSDISVIDPSTNTVIETIPGIPFPFGQEFNPNNDTLYVGNPFANIVTAINVTNNTVIGTIPVGTVPVSMEVNKSTNLMYVGNIASSNISVIDTTTNLVVDTIAIPGGVGLVGINENTNTVYVPTFFANQVLVLDGSSNTIIDSISVGNSVRRAIYNSDLDEVYAISFDTNTLSVIDPSTNTVVASVLVDTPFAMNLNRATNVIYVANQIPNTITVIDISANSPPIANAGINQLVIESQTVFLNGTASFDSDGDPLLFQWDQISGTPVLLSNSTNPTPNFIAPNVTGSEVLSFQLIVDDGIFQSVPDVVDILVTELANFDVILNPISSNTLNGNVTISGIPSDTPIILNFINPENFLTRGELDHSIITTTSSLTDVTVEFQVSSDIPSTLPDLPKDDSALFFDINFQGFDLSDPSKFPINEFPNTQFTIPKNANAVSRFSDDCPIVPFYLFNEITNQWEQLGMPEEPNTNQVFVADTVGNSVSVIDISSNNVVENIPVGSNPRALGFNPNTNLLYVSNFGENSVSIIDTTTNIIIKTVPVSGTPFGMALDLDNNKIYVVLSTGNVVIIDGFTNTVSETITIPGTMLIDIDLDFDNQKAFVSDFSNRNLHVIDLATNLLENTITVDDGAATIAIVPNQNKAYVSMFLKATVFVIDTKNESVLKVIPVESAPTGVAFNPVNNKVYVTNTISNTVSIIDVNTDTLIKNIKVGQGPFRVDVIQDINRIYVSNGDSGTVSIIDGDRDVVIDTVEVGGITQALATNPRTSNPVRDPGTDVLDISNNIFECSYLANLPHLSKFAVGGISIGSTANFIGGSGGGSGAPTVTLGTLIYNNNFYVPNEIERIVENFDPKIPIAPMDPNLYEDFVFPFTVNYNPYNGYPLVGYENTIETNIVEVGTPVTLEFNFFEQTEIQHFSLYSGLYGSKTNPSESNIQILYNKNSELKTKDPSNSITDVKVSENDLGNNIKQIVVEFTPLKENSIKDLIVRSWDPRLSSSDIIIRNAFEIVPKNDINLPVLQDEPEEILELESQPIPDWIKNNAGWWAEQQITDEDFVSGIEYLIQNEVIKISKVEAEENSITQIPDWIRVNTGWWSESLISDEEFIDAIEWLLENGIMQV